jgi:predicted nucleic-acid-binding Zn-ribbon protein
MSLRNGVCPHCEKSDIRVNSVISMIIKKSDWIGPHYAGLKTFVCINCGYVEQYVMGAKNIEYVSEHWEVHDPRKKKKNEK